MNNNTAFAGNYGKKVRSDCYVEIEFTDNTGINIDLESKVYDLFGKSIKSLVNQIFEFYEIKNARVKIIDSGALDFVISARVEAAIKKLKKTDKEYLPEFIPENNYITEKDKFRFSRLYLPGNNPTLMLNAGLHSPDGIILDLEDSVSPSRKHEARFIVRNALRSIDFKGAERMVRINQGETGLEDLNYIIPHKPNLILIPKVESTDYIKKIDKKISEFSDSEKIHLMPIIESALGVENSFKLAKASERIVSLALGLEDYTADIGTQRTKEGKESEWARHRIVNAAKSAGKQPIDSVFSDVEDTEGLRKNVQNSKMMGFEGMGCIHPRQIQVIQQEFLPGESEIEYACKVADAYYTAEEKGLGVVSLGSKMIDPPVVDRAMKTISLAISFNLLSKDWRKDYVS